MPHPGHNSQEAPRVTALRADLQPSPAPPRAAGRQAYAGFQRQTRRPTLRGCSLAPDRAPQTGARGPSPEVLGDPRMLPRGHTKWSLCIFVRKRPRVFTTFPKEYMPPKKVENHSGKRAGGSAHSHTSGQRESCCDTAVTSPFHNFSKSVLPFVISCRILLSNLGSNKQKRQIRTKKSSKMDSKVRKNSKGQPRALQS